MIARLASRKPRCHEALEGYVAAVGIIFAPPKGRRAIPARQSRAGRATQQLVLPRLSAISAPCTSAGRVQKRRGESCLRNRRLSMHSENTGSISAGSCPRRSTECPVGLLLQSRNRASDGQSRAGKFGEQRRRDNRSGNLVLPPFSARRSAQTLRIARDLDWP